MAGKLTYMRRRALVLAIAAIGVVALGGTALAGHQTSGVKSYTGCLVAGDGVIIKVKEGNAPRSACTGGQVEAHFSGGDITAITAQTDGGLTGGGENGAVSLSIRRDCVTGEVVKWSDSAWACAADSNSTYTAGAGLDLSSGGEFSIHRTTASQENRALPAGEFARGFNSSGEIQCAAPPSSTVQAVGAAQAGYPGPASIPDDGAFRGFVSVAPTPGTYVVTAKGIVLSELNADSGTSTDCQIRNGSAMLDSVGFGAPTLNDDRQTPFALTGIASVSSGTIELACAADDGADGVSLTYARLVAVEVG